MQANDTGERIALFDLDGSLANYDEAMRRDLRAMNGPHDPAIDERTNLHDLEESHSYMDARMRFIKANPGWWRELPRIDVGFRIVDLAKRIGYTINVLTKAPSSHPAAWMEKYEWCRAQPELADADVHLTMNKGLVYGTFLYDDYPAYMEQWLRHRRRGLGIMPVTPYNADWNHPNVVKWDGTNREQIETALRIAYARPAGAPLLLT